MLPGGTAVPLPDTDTTSLGGHGTHVAGIVAGAGAPLPALGEVRDDDGFLYGQGAAPQADLIDQNGIGVTRESFPPEGGWEQLTRDALQAGASGYILKDDQAAFRELGNVVLSVAHGGIFFRKKAHNLYMQASVLENGEMLTPRQMEVISLCAAYPDASTADLAEMMSISNSTVRNLLSSVYLRLGVHSRTAGANSRTV